MSKSDFFSSWKKAEKFARKKITDFQTALFFLAKNRIFSKKILMT